MRKRLALCLALCMLLAGCGFQTECQKHSITLFGTFDTVVTLTGYASEKTFQQEAGKVREMLEYYSMVFDAYQAPTLPWARSYFCGMISGRHMQKTRKTPLCPMNARYNWRRSTHA